MSHVAGGSNQHPVARVVLAHELQEAVAIEGAHGAAGADHRTAEGMALPHALQEEVVDQLVWLIFDLADLLQDHPLLQADVRRAEGN